MAASAGSDGRLRLALAGGGTGGHVVPGLHLIAHLRGSQRLGHLLWFGAGREAEERSLAGLDELAWPAPVERVALRLEPAGGGAPTLPALALRTLPAVLRARRALARARSQVLLGLGGFTCLPAVLAARSLGVPVALLEINAARGKATRVLAGCADLVFHAWPDSLPQEGGGAHLCVGPPLAPNFLRSERGESERADCAQGLGFDPRAPLLLVLGGSQGAAALNRFVAAECAGWLARGIQVLHQVGPGRLAEGIAAGGGYRKAEFVSPVEPALRAATFVLCRGGASTLAELGALRVPSMVVPYPHHRDQHQARNARALGAGTLCVSENELGPAVGLELARLCSPDGRTQREAMARALVGAVPRDASARILQELGRLASAAPSAALGVA